MVLATLAKLLVGTLIASILDPAERPGKLRKELRYASVLGGRRVLADEEEVGCSGAVLYEKR